MHSADFAVARCPSVCLFVRPSVRPSHAGILSKRLNISWNVLHHRVAILTILVFFPYQTVRQYADGNPYQTGASNFHQCFMSEIKQDRAILTMADQ